MKDGKFQKKIAQHFEIDIELLKKVEEFLKKYKNIFDKRGLYSKAIEKFINEYNGK